VSGAVAVTGASGYLGRRVVDRFVADGRRVVRLVRRPSGPADLAYDLARAVDPETLRARAVEAIVHCAYDASPIRDHDVAVANIEGSERLLAAAEAAGVARIVVISSMSAFAGCRSSYGRTKLVIEGLAPRPGAAVVRPGLIWEDDVRAVGGMVGRLARSAQSRVVPLPAPRATLHLVHIDDLCDLVAELATADAVPPHAVVAADATPWSMRGIVGALADGAGRMPLVVPVPWRPTFWALRAAERVGRPLPFRSDSLVGLVHADPAPDLSAAARFRPFGGAAVRDAAQTVDAGWPPV
jgi:nucleoside-diphosphate-sugar epimerase